MLDLLGSRSEVRRVGFGPLVLDVTPGKMRELEEDEVLQLHRAARKRSPQPSDKPTRRPRSGPATLPRKPAKRAAKRVLGRKPADRVKG